MSLPDGLVPVTSNFGVRKRKRISHDSADRLPMRVLFYSPVPVPNGMRVRIHGALTIISVNALPTTPQHKVVEYQRGVHGQHSASCQFREVRWLEPVVEIGNGFVTYMGNTATIAKCEPLLEVVKSLGMIGWPRIIKVPTEFFWALGHNSIPALLLPQNTYDMLGIKVGGLKAYTDGCWQLQPTVETTLQSLCVPTSKPASLSSDPISHVFEPSVVIRGWILRRHLRGDVAVSKILLLSARLVLSEKVVAELER
jgi:hypothetical protein